MYWTIYRPILPSDHTETFKNKFLRMIGVSTSGDAQFCASPFFDRQYYLESNPDVKKLGLNPIKHYLRFGKRELRSPSPYFEPVTFLQAHPYLDTREVDLAEICIRLYGSFAWEECSVAPTTLQEISRPLSHSERKALFKAWGKYFSFFDASFYLDAYPEIGKTGLEAFLHYMHKGFTEDRMPRADFDAYTYRKIHSLEQGQNPFKHYIDHLKKSDSFSGCTGHSFRLPQATKSMHNLRLCIHVHCFYLDIFTDIINRLKSVRSEFSLIVTVCDEENKLAVQNLLDTVGLNLVSNILLVQNRGRDIAPFIVDARPIWVNFDVVLHLHTKRSPHISWGDNWRRYLLDNTIGTNEIFDRVINAFVENQKLGVAYPVNYCMIRRFTEKENNMNEIKRVAGILDISPQFISIGDYAAGSMAFYRVSALKRLDLALLDNAFEEEFGQDDGTVAHTLERLLPEAVRQAGYESVDYQP